LAANVVGCALIVVCPHWLLLVLGECA